MSLHFKSEDELQKWLAETRAQNPQRAERQKRQVCFDSAQKRFSVGDEKQRDWPIELIVLYVVCIAGIFWLLWHVW